MKKLGFLIFLGVLAIGFVAASASSFGKLDTGGLFHFNFGGVRCAGNDQLRAAGGMNGDGPGIVHYIEHATRPDIEFPLPGGLREKRKAGPKRQGGADDGHSRQVAQYCHVSPRQL